MTMKINENDYDDNYDNDYDNGYDNDNDFAIATNFKLVTVNPPMSVLQLLTNWSNQDNNFA